MSHSVSSSTRLRRNRKAMRDRQLSGEAAPLPSGLTIVRALNESKFQGSSDPSSAFSISLQAPSLKAQREIILLSSSICMEVPPALLHVDLGHARSTSRRVVLPGWIWI